MNDIIEPRREPLLFPELYKRNPLWFRGAVAYRLLRIMTPKPLTRRLPTILRAPLLMPGFTLPPDWTEPDPLPPSLILPPGETLPDGWLPGDPLPEGAYIDTSIYFPNGWQAGDPPPEGYVPPPDSFSDIPDIDSPVPPVFTAPSESAGPITPPKTTPPSGEWQSFLTDAYWNAFRGRWYLLPSRWEPQGGSVQLIADGTWFVGYRPTQMRVTFTTDATIWVVLECGTGGVDPIYSNQTYTSLTEVDLTWESDATAHDIFSLKLLWMTGTIIGIEFFA